MAKKKTTSLFWIVALVLIGYFFIDYYLYKKALEEPLDPDNKKIQSIIIKKGSSAETIGELLEAKGIIEDGDIFYRYAKNEDKSKNLLSGKFELNPSMTVPEIAETLSDAKKAKNVITIPEGFSIKQIDEELAEENLIQPGAFIKETLYFKNPFTAETGLEGYLFPDTYFIDAGNFSSQKLIQMMLDNFRKKLPENTTENTNNKSLHEIITVASLLEKEIKTEKDLPIVAGIIWKRIESGWYLNIDATTLYAKGNEAYNTYKKKGLPPSPIGNPGLKTIKAAINPEKSSYWFYITKLGTGEVVYAKTNEEQNINRGKYLR